MTEILIWAAIFAGIMAGGMVIGMFLAHFFTMRGIAHVQPAYKEIRPNADTGRSYTLPDPWADEENVPDSVEESEFEKQIKEEFKKTGLEGTGIDAKDFFGYKAHMGSEEKEEVTSESQN